MDIENLRNTSQIIPAQSFRLEAVNLRYTILTRKNGTEVQKILLNNVSVAVHHGEILGIVGPSGAGKSTFLDAMAGQIDSKALKGSILVNGKPMKPSFKRMSGYVMQDDALFPMLTVRETLMFSAKLRLSPSMASHEKRRRVDTVIQELGLQSCSDTKIGNEEVRGISGGERRRVSIGVDLIHDPPVLFLDEPTSGLDSTSALNVVSILHSMATKRGRTILLTIHQPSFRILGLLHKILVLSRGSLAYHGPYDGLLEYLRGFGRHVPEQVNMLEYMLDMVQELEAHPSTLRPLIQYANTHASRVSQVRFAEDFVEHTQLDVEKKYANGFFRELAILIHRSSINIFRSRTLFIAKTFLLIFTGLTMGSVFWQLGYSMKGIRQRQSFFAFIVALIVFTSTDGLSIYLEERQIFLRETSRGAYRVATYVLSGAIVFVPFLFFLTCTNSTVAYFMVGLDPSFISFFIYVAAVFQTFIVANSFVVFMAALIPDFISANTVITSFNAYFYLFSGFYIAKERIPKYWVWMHYISSFKYPLEVMGKNEYEELTNVCWDPSSGGCALTSDQVLESLSLTSVSIVWNSVAMAGFFVVYRLLYYIVLKSQAGHVRK